MDDIIVIIIITVSRATKITVGRTTRQPLPELQQRNHVSQAGMLNLPCTICRLLLC